MLLRIRDSERGASMLEYSAIFVLVAAMFVAVAMSGIADRPAGMISDALDRIAGNTPGSTGSDSGEDTPGDGDEENAGGGTDSGGSGDDEGSPDGDGSGNDGDDGSEGSGGDDGGDDGCGWNLFCHGGNAVDAAGDGLSTAWEWTTDTAAPQVGGFFVGLGGGIWNDVTGIGDIFTTNPIDTVTGMWEGIKEDPWSLLISQEAREAWSNGDYGAAIGGGLWDVGSWFVPGVGWAAKGGKLGKLGRLGDNDNNGNGSNNDSDSNDNNDSSDRDSEDFDAACRRGGSSFLPGTEVLMADGDRQPIETIEVGDEVWAFDPATGAEGPRAVTALPSSDGVQPLTRVTVRTADATTESVTATSAHPFYDPDSASWLPAGELAAGIPVRSASGAWGEVVGVEVWREPDQQVHNLTVDDLSTYYVEVGGSTALVHNQSGYDCGDDLDDTLDGIHTTHGPNVGQGVEHMMDEIEAGKTSHRIAGKSSLDDLAEYLSGREGRTTHTDTDSGRRISYDANTKDADGNGVLIVESEHSVHAYHMSPTEWENKVRSGRYAEN